MDPLTQQLRDFPKRVGTLPAAVKWGAAAAVLVAVAAAALLWGGAGDRWQYAYTNLASEDSAEVAATLKASGVPFRLEAGGAALAVPADKVYDVRLMLAAAGLPRGGGAGFELFDRGDLGVSEFTQKVNLRRALEGELARTVGHLANVRSARVHLTLSEKGLYRDEERKASAAVVLQLQPGRAVGEREVSGIRHLVASSVPGLDPDAVTIVDGRGTALTSGSAWGEAEVQRQRDLERSLERSLVTLLEPAVGQGAVVARVSATLDNSEISTTKETVDPQGVLRTERKATQSAQTDAQLAAAGAVAGAAANQPPAVAPPVAAAPQPPRSTSSSQDEQRAYDVGRTVQRTQNRGYRVARLSIALLVDGIDGNPRTDDELQRLAELARKAVGFDEARGDQLEITSSVFTKSTEPAPEAAAAPAPRLIPGPPWIPYAAGGLGLLLLAVLVLRSLRGGGGSGLSPELRVGQSVAALEAALQGASPQVINALNARSNEPPDPNLSLRDRARELVNNDPSRAALLLRAWITEGGRG